MKIKRCLQEFFKAFDLFAISQFLKYKQEESYNTASGGIASLIVVSIFLALFANTAL